MHHLPAARHAGGNADRRHRQPRHHPQPGRGDPGAGANLAAIEALARPGSAPEALVARLCEVPGVGPWTAHYIAMRTLGWPDAFPPGDVAALKAMRTLYASTSQRDAERHAEAWRPWRAYALLRLWNSLDKEPLARSAMP